MVHRLFVICWRQHAHRRLFRLAVGAHGPHLLLLSASARIYHWQLTILQSLFHLFRGKKHNVLRNRIDSCDYDLDQLLVGTILFTLLFFLLPTVGVFYLNFAIARMIIISMKAGFDTMLSCLNHFPLFALMLRIKDPRRLPGKRACVHQLVSRRHVLTCSRRHPL